MHTTTNHARLAAAVARDGHLVSTHRTSDGVVAYVRRPDGRLRVVELDVDTAVGAPCPA